MLTPLPAYPAGVDTRSKKPLLHLETAAAAGLGNGSGGVWPPPRSGRENGPDSDDIMSLEAPLLAPSAPPMLVASDSDDCFLDDAINEVCVCVFFSGCAPVPGVGADLVLCVPSRILPPTINSARTRKFVNQPPRGVRPPSRTLPPTINSAKTSKVVNQPPRGVRREAP